MEKLTFYHNKTLLDNYNNCKCNNTNDKREGIKKNCNCRITNKCPLNGECLSDNIVYRTSIKYDNQLKYYFGSTEIEWEQILQP